MADFILFRDNYPEIGRLLRFMTVGISGTVLDFTVLTLLKEIFLWPTLLANTFSFGLGVINNFTWNRLWTFSDAQHSNIARQFMQFFVISVIGVLLNNLIVLSLEHPFDSLLGVDGYGYLPAKVIATGIVFFWNFGANRYWTFNTLDKGFSA